MTPFPHVAVGLLRAFFSFLSSSDLVWGSFPLRCGLLAASLLDRYKAAAVSSAHPLCGAGAPQRPINSPRFLLPESKTASITFEEAEEHAWEEIRKYVGALPPYEFQDMVAALLKALGYFVTWIAPPGKDGGIDVLAWSDPLGVKPPRVKVQVKRQQAKVSVDGLRSFLAVLGDEDVGIFVCTGGFTKDAEDEARTQEKRKIRLIDLERFVDMWTECYPRLEDAAKRKLPLQPIWFLAPME